MILGFPFQGQVIFRFRVFASIPVTVFFFAGITSEISTQKLNAWLPSRRFFLMSVSRLKLPNGQIHQFPTKNVPHRFNNCFKHSLFFCLVSWGMTRFNNFDIYLPTFKGCVCVCFPKKCKNTHGPSPSNPTPPD